MCSFFSPVWIFILLQISHVAGHFSIKPPKNPIIGYLEMEVILPCQIEISRPLTDTNINVKWILDKSTQKIEVKNYQGATEHKRYQGRTQLFDSEFNKGNMSLLLRNISLSDQGQYTCIISSQNWYDEAVVELLLTANGGNPTITLADYKGTGIGLTCNSEGWYPRPQALWLDKNGKNRTEKSAIANTEVTAGIFRFFGSITLEPGVDSEVSCKIINNLVKSERESRILVSESLQEVSQLEKETNEKKREQDYEKNAIETEKSTSQASIIGIQENQKRLKCELELRRVQSHAVAVYLDPDCKHPDIAISKDGKSATLKPFGEAKPAGGFLVVVGKEGYVAGKHYWEVKVGDWLDWELGVLTQAQRDRTRKEKFSVPLGEECWALKSVRGDLFSSQKEEKIEKKDVPYSNIGLFLDQDSGKIDFYGALMQTPLLITTITIQSTEKLYPFLSFGECALDCAQNSLEVIHMKIPLPFQKL